ncbi:MAG: thioesterase family protein [Tidjanibacter sp.]|nr:thioesterase family protein [Tidjanibacter sp.]
MELKTGLTASSVEQVTENKCAVNVGSGDLMVYATPSMAALMENAAMKAVAEALPEGSTTVGSLISTSHMKPTPVGATVTATAELVQVEGRKLVFKIFAEDQNGPIGEGEHVRFVVDRERFMAKLK